MTPQKIILLISFIFFIGGCGYTVNHTKNRSNICGVHQIPMKIETLRIRPDYIGYLPDYMAKMMEEFPNYSGPRWDEVSYILGARWIKTYVCPKCTEAYRHYHESKDIEEKDKAQSGKAYTNGMKKGLRLTFPDLDLLE